jgi:hypothetical protein
MTCHGDVPPDGQGARLVQLVNSNGLDIAHVGADDPAHFTLAIGNLRTAQRLAAAAANLVADMERNAGA